MARPPAAFLPSTLIIARSEAFSLIYFKRQQNCNGSKLTNLVRVLRTLNGTIFAEHSFLKLYLPLLRSGKADIAKSKK